MANQFNMAQDIQYTASQFGQPKLSDRDKLLIETLLADAGVFAIAAPTPGPTPGPLPAPSPTPASAPTPTPGPTPTLPQGSGSPVNLFLRLALNKVGPGDLITAQFANDIVDALLALDARLRALEGMGRTTPAPASPTPSPTPAPTPTHTPTPSPAETSLTRGRTSEAPEPTIESATATTVPGKGVTIAVTGDNIGEGLLERVMLGTAQIAPSSIKFGRGGFSFRTTSAIVKSAKSRLTVVTSGGEDSAALTSGSRG
jgi:hypothetical protein